MFCRKKTGVPISPIPIPILIAPIYVLLGIRVNLGTKRDCGSERVKKGLLLYLTASLLERYIDEENVAEAKPVQQWVVVGREDVYIYVSLFRPVGSPHPPYLASY